jgi:hypothetical protein
LTSHDQLAKDLIQTFFPGFLRLAAPEAAARLRLDEAVFLDKQAFTDWPQGDRREMDLLAEVPAVETGARILIHIEIEAEARADMADRFWGYYMQLRLRHGLTIVPILINLTGGRPGAHDELLVEGFEGLETARFRFRVFSLSGCRAEEYLALAEPLAWALAALMRRGEWSRAEHKIECLRRIAAADLSGSQRWLLGNWVETYLQLNDRETAEYARLCELTVNQEVRAMEMTWAERMEEKYTKMGLEKGFEQGKKQGVELGRLEGKLEGKLEGRLEGMRQILLQLLGRRFGAVPETVRRKVESMEESAPLTDLTNKVLDAQSIEELGLS